MNRVLCDTIPGNHEQHLFILDREPMTEQRTDAIKAQLGEPMSFIVLLKGVQMKGYLQE